MKFTILRLLIIFALIYCSQPVVFAQQVISMSVSHKIDSLYRGFATKNHLPGLVYGIVYNGKLIYKDSWGYANLKDSIKVNEKTVFRIASMTKSFISAAIVKLRDEGKLQLDDPISRYIPALKTQTLLTTDAPVITIRHLLTHAAGFPEDNPWGDRQLDMSEEALTAMLKRGFSFSNAPGITYEYSNTAFALLGYAIKQITGASYDEYITKEILAPLGMEHTYWEYSQVPKANLAIGYRWVSGKWIEQPMLHNGTYGAMGGMLTSMEDFAKYVQLHLNAWPARSDKDVGPVKRSSLREMQHPWNFNSLVNIDGCAITNAYAYGLRWSHDCKGKTMVGHTGGLPGFGSNWLILPDYGLGLICFGNVTYAATAAINMKVMDMLVQEAHLQARKIRVSSILKQRKKELLNFLPDWKLERRDSVFAANFFLDNYEAVLREECEQLFKKIGNIKQIGGIVAQNNLRGTFEIYGEKGTLSVYFTLSPEKEPKIQQLQIRMKERT